MNSFFLKSENLENSSSNDDELLLNDDELLLSSMVYSKILPEFSCSVNAIKNATELLAAQPTELLAAQPTELLAVQPTGWNYVGIMDFCYAVDSYAKKLGFVIQWTTEGEVIQKVLAKLMMNVVSLFGELNHDVSFLQINRTAEFDDFSFSILASGEGMVIPADIISIVKKGVPLRCSPDTISAHLIFALKEKLNLNVWFETSPNNIVFNCIPFKY